MAAISLNSDLGSRIVGVAPMQSAYGLGRLLVPDFAQSVSVSVGSPFRQIYWPQKTPYERSRTVSITGFRTFDREDPLDIITAFTSPGLQSCEDAFGTPTPLQVVSADGKLFNLVKSRYAGGSLSAVSVGGALYWMMTANHTGALLSYTTAVAAEKANASLDPLPMAAQVPLPIQVVFADGLSSPAITTTLGRTVVGGVDKCNFFIKQIAVSVTGVEAENLVSYFPYGLELWGCTPRSCDPTVVPVTLGDYLTQRGGLPLTASADMLLAMGYSPDWADYGLTAVATAPYPNGTTQAAYGIGDPWSYWQSGTCTGELYAKVSISISGWFTDPGTATTMWKQLTDAETGTLEFRDPATDTVLSTLTYARMSSASQADDYGTAGGKPEVSATLTFEGYMPITL